MLFLYTSRFATLVAKMQHYLIKSFSNNNLDGHKVEILFYPRCLCVDLFFFKHICCIFKMINLLIKYTVENSLLW